MGLIDRIRAGWDAVLGRAVTYGDFFGEGGGPRAVDPFGARRSPGKARLAEGYKGLIYACANINVRRLVKTPLRLYAVTKPGMRPLRAPHARVSRSAARRLASLAYIARDMAGSESIDEITEHPLLDALDGRGPDPAMPPNPHFDRTSLLAYAGLCLEVAGDFICRWEDNGFGAPGSFWPVAPQACTPVPDERGRLKTWSHAGEEIPQDRLLWVSLKGLRSPYGAGYSPAEAAWIYADLEQTFAAVQAQLLGRAPNPSAVIGPADAKMPWTEDQIKRVRADVRRQTAGPEGGGILVTPGSYTYTPMGARAVDVSGLGIAEYDLQRVANCFGVPLPLLMAETNLANLQAAELQHAPVVEDRCVRIAAALTRLAQRFDPRLLFAFDEVSEEDEEREARVHDVRLKNGSMTVNESRAACGFDPVPWGEEPWLPSTLRQPSEERPKPTPPPGAPAPAGGPGEGPNGPQDATDGQDAADGPADGTDATTRALDARALDLIERIAERLDHADPDAGGPGRDPWLRGAEADAPAPEPVESVRAAERRADHEDAAPVVPGPEGGDPGDAPGAGGAAAVGVPDAGGLQRPDGVGDDADPGTVLGPGGQGRGGPAGAGPVGVEGDGPQPSGEDPLGGIRVLRVDEQDDEP